MAGSIANLDELKVQIAQHIINVTLETLQSVVEHVVYLFIQVVAGNSRQQIERVLNKSSCN